MKISEYVDYVVRGRKKIFCNIELDESFNKNDLKKLCNLKIKRPQLITAWSLIIDFLNDNFYDDVQEYLTPDILDFLISNDLCLCSLGHLRLSREYLMRIYEKDNSCWEALENINSNQE